MKTQWRSGNAVDLLENGDAFFPRVFGAIDEARREVLVETFILEDNEAGTRCRQALVDAARRGVSVELTLDAWGSMHLPRSFTDAPTEAGIRLRLFDLTPAWRLRVAWFRRLHRELVVVDGTRALLGGINYSADQIANRGRRNKQDDAVEVRGPVVADMRAEMIAATPQWAGWLPTHTPRLTAPDTNRGHPSRRRSA